LAYSILGYINVDIDWWLNVIFHYRYIFFDKEKYVCYIKGSKDGWKESIP